MIFHIHAENALSMSQRQSKSQANIRHEMPSFELLARIIQVTFQINRLLLMPLILSYRWEEIPYY